ncbi:MAG: thioredoxin [Clostridia bacterium]|nr:thioredoxin [Clostridia bacterium]MBO5786129.1 thioredoxin [Clostridia bacterium]
MRISLLIIALFLLVYGYIIGGTADVLTKAVNICTECIGLG